MAVRIYGNLPVKVAVIHGGPGAPGYMAPVAREISQYCGVIEPLQSASSLSGQIEELNSQLNEHCDDPICLIGSSWGATLALLYTSRYSKLVSKIILTGSCVYDGESSKKIEAIRLERMLPEERVSFKKLESSFKDLSGEELDQAFLEYAGYFHKTDNFNPITSDMEVIECQQDVNSSVWDDFKKLRDEPNKLANLFSNINVPVVNIHGDYDPHIIEGIQPFLESCIKDVKLYLLKNCGHYPWIEKEARERFFDIIRSEI